jgi:hypothetical protein
MHLQHTILQSLHSDTFQHEYTPNLKPNHVLWYIYEFQYVLLLIPVSKSYWRYVLPEDGIVMPKHVAVK